ncbi:MAG TPA: hypothetical protein VMY38_05020, partial [Gemmatimonadaceae bacterium]|nr:hypothetical protein [Gemmatimonadaceae bacterium]
MRRSAPAMLAIVGVLALLTWYVAYTRTVVRDLSREASRVGLMYARVYDALNDTNPDAANAALLDLAAHIREAGVPMVLTDTAGNVTALDNLPFDAAPDSPEVREYVARLDRENAPVVDPS